MNLQTLGSVECDHEQARLCLLRPESLQPTDFSLIASLLLLPDAEAGEDLAEDFFRARLPDDLPDGPKGAA